MSELIYKNVSVSNPSGKSYAIMGACFNVYKTMGCGFLESVYQECLELEFEYQGIPFLSQNELLLTYRDKELKQKYRADFICFEKIIIELKATSELIIKHESQIINYLHATKFKLGILVNFGHHPKLEYKRFVF